MEGVGGGRWLFKMTVVEDWRWWWCSWAESRAITHGGTTGPQDTLFFSFFFFLSLPVVSLSRNVSGVEKDEWLRFTLSLAVAWGGGGEGGVAGHRELRPLGSSKKCRNQQGQARDRCALVPRIQRVGERLRKRPGPRIRKLGKR